MELSKHIAHLLQKHNCVIVPDFGGFIANYKSAVIDHSKMHVMPPSKSVLFNPNLVNNDGLLGNSIAHEKEITYPSALDLISDNVNDWKKQLSNGNRIEIGEIGFLFQQDGQIILEQNRETNLLLNAYGLTSIRFVNFEKELLSTLVVENKEIKIEAKPFVKLNAVSANLQAKPIEKETPVIVLESAVETATISENETQAKEDPQIIQIERKHRSRLKYIAVAVAIPLLFYSYWIPMETDFIDTGKIQVSDFNPIHKTSERIYKLRETTFDKKEYLLLKSWDELTENLRENAAVYNYHFDDELYIPIKLDKTATSGPKEIATINENNNEVLVGNTNQALPYHIIGGCFSVKSNADQLVKDLIDQGYKASIFDLKNGLYRVSAGDYQNKDTANDNLNHFKNGGFSGWILKK